MEPLQKKYLLASSGLHLLLLTLLLFGSGFLPDRKEEDPLIPFRMMPTSVLESLMNDAADVASPQPEPKPEPKPRPKPVIKINTHTKKNPRRASAPANQRTTPRPQASRPTVALNQETLKVGQGSPVKGIQTVTGSMRGSYARTVQAAYDKRWIQPSGLSDRQLQVQVEVIIALNGSVQSARILKKSGNRALDQSIQALLKRVKKMPERPPSGSSVDDRTVVLNFNIK